VSLAPQEATTRLASTAVDAGMRFIGILDTDQFQIGLGALVERKYLCRRETATIARFSRFYARRSWSV
jgi:hypothetical protein